MTLAVLMVAAVTSIWDYPTVLAKRPQVVQANGMVATVCDDEPPESVPARGVVGRPLTLQAHNVGWDAEVNCFSAKLDLRGDSDDGNAGDLYMNRDGNHSRIKIEEFPGLTEVRLDEEAHRRYFDHGVANILFPRPLFGNSSVAYNGVTWRSVPRFLMTNGRDLMPAAIKMYRTNQFWVYPSAGDTPPVGTNGDVCASIAPYWLMTAGRSWSDLPYLKAALEVSAAFDPSVKKEIVRRGLLVPTIQTLMRKSLKGVDEEAAYLTPKAHPTAMPPNGLDLQRLIARAQAFKAEEIPPLAKVKVEMVHILGEQTAPGEVTYASDHACAIVLRSPDRARCFRISAVGDDEYEFFQSHGDPKAVKIERVLDVAAISIDRSLVTPTNRVDIAVVAKTAKSGWGAPSYVSFAVIDEKAPYCDPVLVLRKR